MSNPVFGTGTGSVVGVTGIPAYGQRDKILFGGVWAIGDSWSISLVTTQGDATLGVGNFGVETNTTVTPLSPNVCFTYKNRVYLGLGSQFNFSDNSDPTSWEVQAPGAGSVSYLSYFGSQDSITALQQLQGRLVVIGQRSTQIWTVDADPANFAIVQEMDNIGSSAPQSVQNIGDFDVIILDATGFRSLRQREVTLNAYVDDVGVPIDSLVQADLAVVQANTCCSIVEPTSKRYWGYLNGKIYVLSRFPSSKISAWSTYDCVDSKDVPFVPVKFIIFNDIVYCRTTDNRLIAFGGGNGQAYDGTVMTVELPWLDHKQPKMEKLTQALDITCLGQWHVTVSMDPKSFVVNGTTAPAIDIQGAKGDESFDSTNADFQRFSWSGKGTHLKMICKTDPAWTDIATLSEIQWHYNPGRDS